MDPLHQLIAAVKLPDPAAVGKLLREHPGLVNARDETGDSILLMSLYGNHPEVRDLILAAGPEISIFEAAALGDLGRLRSRLAGFPELAHAFSHDGFTALHLAAFFGHEECARALLDADADPNAVSRNQTYARLSTPLHSAAASGRVNVVRLLLDRGSAVDARQEGGFTALHAAASAGDADLAVTLLRSGADPGLRADDHRTALDIAREKGHAAVERLLT